MLENRSQPRPVVLFPDTPSKKKRSYHVLFEIIDIDGNSLTHFSGVFQAC